MKYFFVFLLICLNSLCFAVGEINITLPFDSVTTSGILKDNVLDFPNKEGTVSTQLNLLRDRSYSVVVSATGEKIEVSTDIKFLYKYGYVGAYNNTTVINSGDNSVTGSDFLTTPDRFDKTILTLTFKSDTPFTVSKITVEGTGEPLLYGHFITPFYRGNLTADMPNITFRYYSNHEEKGFEDNSVVLNTYIYNEAGVVYTQTEKVTNPKGYIVFKVPNLSLGDYTFKIETKHGEDVLAVYELPLHFTNQMPSFYCDQNGRLIKDNAPFLLVGLMGNLEGVNLEEAKTYGVNTAPQEEFFQIGKDIIIHNIENPADFEGLKALKVGDAPTLFVLNNITFANFSVVNSDFIGFNFIKNPFSQIEAFFKDYGFYYPLIEVMDAEKMSEEIFWETVAQTQTGFIFNLNSKEDFEKIKPYLKFLSDNKDIILSNDEPKSLVFGSCPSFIRKYKDEEFVFVFETKGRESDEDVFAPNKKDKVYIGDKLLEADKKDKTKYSFKIEPYQNLIVRIESVK